jgi:hypothetical protein
MARRARVSHRGWQPPQPQGSASDRDPPAVGRSHAGLGCDVWRGLTGGMGRGARGAGRGGDGGFRWRDPDESELAELKPRDRRRVEAMIAKVHAASGKAATAGARKGHAVEEAAPGAAEPASLPPPPSRRRLYQRLEFRGVCVQNKAGKFPCPTAGKLLERGVSATCSVGRSDL